MNENDTEQVPMIRRRYDNGNDNENGNENGMEGKARNYGEYKE